MFDVFNNAAARPNCFFDKQKEQLSNEETASSLNFKIGSFTVAVTMFLVVCQIDLQLIIDTEREEKRLLKEQLQQVQVELPSIAFLGKKTKEM